ncbi:RDD family protein [Cellulomonas wangsupingiae]|uniref:RDD family protein n=1 Tax=Cellulomonas wangsupingiae TaxID=2968085 RepID=A0ABY5K3D4_9CELL|nr:RDD family protein [Cellulomonas wangsupingiae]MCC2333366.1 RDD family protein [Cellulomonas wangsupingiae]UUI63565.1 RDD family protein [Cellulomonas wangsupingiae]
MTVADVVPDPEVERASTPRAPWSMRVLAVVLDAALLATFTWLVAPGATPPDLWPGLSSSSPPDAAGGTTVAVVAAVAALLLLQGWTGASPGKRALGVVVVDTATGRPVGFWRTLLRQVLHLLDAILLLGYLRPLWHPERRTFADSIVRTDVVVASWPPAWRRVPVSVHRGARTVAVALCVLGVVGSFPMSSGGAATAVDQPCVVLSGPPGTTARVRLDAYRSWESRLGVRREVPLEPAPWTVSWEPGAGAGWDVGDVLVRTTVTTTDASGATDVRRGTTPNSVGDTGQHLGEVARGSTSSTGDVTIDSTVLVDGDTVATCSASVRLSPADLHVPGP